MRIPPSPYPPNWPDCDPDDPTTPPTTEELIGEEGPGIPPQPPKINVGRWLRWCYENLSEHHYLLMLKAHRARQTGE